MKSNYSLSLNPEHMKFNVLYLTLLFFSSALTGQTTYNYTLDDPTVCISPIPMPIGGVFPPTNYTNISKPLIAEPFSTNAQCVDNASSIHPSAGNISNVFFGGDAPSGGAGQTTTPIFTRQIFNSGDFPIYLETNFYSHRGSESGNGDYNEAYFWIGPADYQNFSAFFTGQPYIIREGILVGKFPNNTGIFNGNSINEVTTTLVDTVHNFSSYGEWYNFKVVLDILDGDLVVRSVKIDDRCVFDYFFTFPETPWLDNYRLAVCADDLAKDFTIITNYDSFSADFVSSDTTICLGDMVNFTDLSVANECTHQYTYNWSFTGADISTSDQQNPMNVSFLTIGNHSVTLEVSNGFSSRIVTKTITVSPIPTVDLGNDTIICSSSPLLLNGTYLGATYLWSDNSTNSTLTVNASNQYWLEVSAEGCSARDTILIDAVAALMSNLGNGTVAICENESYTINAFQPAATSYLWANGSTEATLDVSESGVYEVELSNSCGDTLLELITIIISQPLPQLELGQDQNICRGDTVTLNATTENGLRYLWQDGTELPQYQVTSAGEYEVTVQNGCGEIIENITITDENCCDLFIPNAFSPNYDGLNDVFKVYQSARGCSTITRFSMEIFDRWGDLVFQSYDINVGWNGFWRAKKSAAGVYVFLIQYSDGTEKYEEKGDLILLK